MNIEKNTKNEQIVCYYIKEEQNNHNAKEDDEYIKFINKKPVYDSDMHKYILDFNRRVKIPSIDNFQIISEDEHIIYVDALNEFLPNFYFNDYNYFILLLL